MSSVRNVGDNVNCANVAGICGTNTLLTCVTKLNGLVKFTARTPLVSVAWYWKLTPSSLVTVVGPARAGKAAANTRKAAKPGLASMRVFISQEPLQEERPTMQT